MLVTELLLLPMSKPHSIPRNFFTARKRSLRRLCFYRCLSFCPQGGRAWLLAGGMCGCSGGGMHGCSKGEHAWLLWEGGVCGCSRGGVHGCSGGACMVDLRGAMRGWSWGVCMVAPRGLHGCSGGVCMVAPGGHAWLLLGGVHGCSRGACMVAPGGCAWLLLGGMCGCSGGACVVFSVRYGQWLGGMHPTGMHSCLIYSYAKTNYCLPVTFLL